MDLLGGPDSSVCFWHIPQQRPHLQALTLDSLELLLDLTQLILLPLNVGLDHPRPLLQLLFYILHGF